MGLSLTQENFTIKDQLGNVKFSMDRKMPAFLTETVGYFNVRNIVENNDTSTVINRQDELILTTNPIINKNDYIVFPYFKIYGGVSDTQNTVLTGGGSIVLRVIRQPSTGLYLGSSILSVDVQEDQLKIVIDHSLDKSGFRNIIGDDLVSVGYKIYYGRFS